jgi:hypothetical protein
LRLDNRKWFGLAVLLIDRRGRISSVPETHIPVPFVHARFRHDLWQVRALLGPYRHDLGVIQAIADELMRGFHAMPRALPYTCGVLDAGERAISAGQIAVAHALPGRVTLSFDPLRPLERHWFDAVVFPTFAVVVDFLSVVLRDADNANALEAALDDSAREVFGGTALLGGPTSVDVAALAPNAGALLQRAVWPLTRRYLGLLPLDKSRRRLRIAWLERRTPAVVAAASAGSSAPARDASSRAAVPSPPSRAGPVSALPDQSPDLSEQAQMQTQALKEAAIYAAMGCEICAQRALARAGV